MVRAGMNIARLNFSHGDFAGHKAVIERIRQVTPEGGRPVTIMADLPGPKIRIGTLADDPLELRQGDEFLLTTRDVTGDRDGVSVSFPRLPRVVKPGNSLFLSDGIIQLEVLRVSGEDVTCRVLVGGELRSNKGLNLPGIDLGMSAFTDHDRDCLRFALENGVHAVSQSFVETGADVEAVRQAADELGFRPFVIAKIERAGALERFDEIVRAADGIMIARGDLGVEIAIERIAVVQKDLTRRANRLGKPVITATHMLESMVGSKRPTRAEVTDVANAIFDGTDCVMLSEESALGRFPVESVRMLARIAAATEPYRTTAAGPDPLGDYDHDRDADFVDLVSRNVRHTVSHVSPTAVLVPSTSGYAARMVSRFRLPVWIVGVSPEDTTCHGLQFSYGVVPVPAPKPSDDWRPFARQWLEQAGLPSKGLLVLTEGPSREHPDANPRLEILDLRR